MACAVNQLVACALDQPEHQRLPQNTLRLNKPGIMSLEGEQRGDKEKGKVGIIKKVCAAIKLKFFIMIFNITVQRFPLDMQWKGLRITRHLQYSKSFAAGFASTLKILVFTQIENHHHCFEGTMQMFQFLEGLVKSFTVSKPGWIIFTFSFGEP